MRAKLIGLGKFLVALLLLTVLYRQVNEGKALWVSLRNAHWIYLLFGALLLPANLGVQLAKWFYLLRVRYPAVKMRAALGSLLFGFTLGLITPGNLGELARALYIHDFNRWTVTGLNVIDKLFNMLIFFTAGILALLYLGVVFAPVSGVLLGGAALLGLGLVTGFWWVALHPAWLNRLIGKRSEDVTGGKWTTLLDALSYFRPQHSAVMLALCTFWLLIICGQYYFFVRAFAPVHPGEAVLAVSALLFTKMVLPISLGDLGIREGAAVFYFSLFGVPRSAAFLAAFLVFIFNFLLPALVGSVLVLRLKWNRNRRIPDPLPIGASPKAPGNINHD